jgi:hypothetical protein
MQYDQVMDKLPLYVFGPLAFAATLLLLLTGIRRAIDRYRSRPTPEQLQATYDSYVHRLLHPQPEAVEKELGKLLPESLVQLYKDTAAIQAAGFQLEKSGSPRWRPKHWQVYCFEPLDLESLNESPYEEDLGPGFCFATTGRSSWYWIAASDQRAKDSPVLFLDYDGGGSHGQTVAASLDEFLNLPRSPLK